MRAVALIVLSWCSWASSGCESCEFSFGSWAVEGTILSDRAIVGLTVRTCATPDGDDCEDAYVLPLSDGYYEFDAWVPSQPVGVTGFSCEFVKHFLVVTAENCGPQAFDLAPASGGEVNLKLICY